MSPTETILKYINGYKLSSALFVAAEFKLFDLINGTNTVEEIASAANTNTRATEILLDLLCSVNILNKNEKYYFLDKEWARLLNSQSVTSMIPLMQLENYMSKHHLGSEKLKAALITGIGSDDLNQNQKENQEILYGKAMNSGGQYSSLCTARILSKIQKGRVLDVGGGIGSHAIKLCQLNQEIEVDIIDKPEMKKECCYHIQQYGLDKRIKFITGDILEYNFRDTYDGILMSNILHLFSEEMNRELLKKLAKVLNKNGVIVLHDFFLDDKKTKNEICSLYTLDWLMQGSLFQASWKDVKEWTEVAGLKFLKEIKYASIPTSIMIVKKVV